MERKTVYLYILHILAGIAIGYFLSGCKVAKRCDAYSIRGYEYIQVVGYTDTVPTLGEEYLHMPPGKYLVKGWKQGQVVSQYVIVRDSQK